MAGPEAGGYQVIVDPQQWYRLKRDLDKFDPELAKALRRRIRNAGNVAAEKVKATLRLTPPTGGEDGLAPAGRLLLENATKVTVSFGKRSAAARIVTSSSRLPEEHKGLLNVYNKTSFRHPVWPGGKPRSEWAWVTQQGRPYFGSVIYKALNAAVTQEIFDAIDDAVNALDAQGKP
ncbi:MAG TPA: hypothetical protein VGC45_15765 [Gryllotalpicola sp.]